jgi:hypothetical protein
MFEDPRPWYRARLIFIGPAAVLLALFVYAIVWALTAQPVLRTDYDRSLRELSANAQPPGRNGWVHLAAAAEATRRNGPCGIPHLLNYNVVGDNEPDAPVLDCLLQTVSWMNATGVFEHLTRAAECPNAVLPDERGYPGDGDREIASMTAAGRARAVEIYLALARADQAEAAAALGEALFVAQALSHQPGGPGPSAAMRVLGTVFGNLHAALMDYPIEAPELRRFLEAALRFRLAPAGVVIEGERLRLMALVQRTHTDNGRESGRLLVAEAAEKPTSRLANLKSVAYPSRRALLEKADEYFDRAEAYAALPPDLRAARPLDTVGFGDSLPSRYEMLVRSLPYWLEMHLHHRVLAECMLGRLTIMVAQELHHAERGVYPASLEELVPTTLPAMPNDPCADVSPILYRRTDNDPLGRGYLLYDPGDNGEDDQGAGDDEVFNTPSPAGAAALRAAVAAAE